jgi:hypothetical protein
MFVNNRQMLEPPKPPKDDAPIKFGILGAANIAPLALISPASSHPGAVVVAVAARDERRARAYAAKHGIPKVFSSYQGRCEQLPGLYRVSDTYAFPFRYAGRPLDRRHLQPTPKRFAL